MFSLIRKDFLLTFSSKTTIFMFLIFVPFFQLVLGAEDNVSVPLISIVLIGYMLTTMSFLFEVKNKPYMTIRSLPIKASDVVISKYLQIFSNYIIALVYSFLYIKILSILGVTVSGVFNITILKASFLLLVLSLSISLPLQFRLPAKIANFVNIFIYISVVNHFSINVYDNTFAYLGEPLKIILIISAFFVSMGVSTLLYKNRNLS